MSNTAPQSTAKYPYQHLAFIAFIVVSIIWGAALPVIKATLTYIPPFTFLFFRFLIVGIVLLPYMVMELGKTKVNKKDFLNLFLLGVFSQTSLGLLFWALEYTTALDSTIIGISGSIMTLIAGHYFYKEKINSYVKIGVILASLGTFIVVLEPIINEAGLEIDTIKRTIGNLVAFSYNIAWTAYIIWSKMSMGDRSQLLQKTLSFIHIRPMTKKYPPTLIVALSMYVGLITLIPLSLMEQLAFTPPELRFNLLALDYRGWLGLLYMAILSSVVAYMLNQWALDNSKVTDSAIFGYLSPVFTFPIAYLLLGEIPNQYMILGGILIAAGVVIAESKNT